MGLFLLEHRQKNRVNARYLANHIAVMGMVCPVILAKQGWSRTHSGPSKLTSHHGKSGFIPYHKHQEVIFPSPSHLILPLHTAHLSKPKCYSSRGAHHSQECGGSSLMALPSLYSTVSQVMGLNRLLPQLLTLTLL